MSFFVCTNVWFYGKQFLDEHKEKRLSITMLKLLALKLKGALLFHTVHHALNVFFQYKANCKLN